MADIEIILEVGGGHDIPLDVDAPEELELYVDESFAGFGVEEYDGPYLVRPAPHEEQVLETKHRLMNADVTVEEIPYYLTTNMQGGYTAIIGE